MAQTVRVWYDAEGDSLGMLLSDEPGYMRETTDDEVMERVNDRRHLLGLPILNVSQLNQRSPLKALLAGHVAGPSAA